MKKTLFSLFVGILALSLNAQIANGDFETWNHITLFEHPTVGFPTHSSNNEAFIATQKANVTRIIENENSFMRIENIAGMEEVIPGYFLYGETPIDGTTFNGGLLVNDTQLSGISMDLKYNMYGSTGMVVIQFGNGTEPIGPGNVGPGTYLFPITGQQDWTTTEFFLDHPIDPATKTCVVGIASADLFYDDNPYKEGAFIEVDNIEFLNSTDEFPNGDFNHWAPVKTTLMPQNVVAHIHPDYPLINQSTESYEGQYAVELNTVVEEDKTHIGSMTLAQKGDTGLEPTIEINNEHALSFMYQYTATNDHALVTIDFYNENQPVYQHTLTLQPTQAYQKMEVPLFEIIDDHQFMATHITISFYSSENTSENPAQMGSRLLIDHVTLESPVGLMGGLISFSSPTIYAYPNPTIGRVAFSYQEPLFGYYQVYNQSGFLIGTQNFSGKQSVYNLYGYPAGVYLFKFYHNKGFQVIKVIKQ